MAYTLIGSIPSPFVRRLRLAMEGISYTFQAIDIYSPEGAKALHELNPTHQIPCLKDGERVIWDSRIILQYLGKKHQWSELSWEDENRLTAIERMIDAGVALFLLKRSNLPLVGMYPERLNERIFSVMQWLAPWMKSPAASEWSLITLTLYAGLDWFKYREVHPIALESEACRFLAAHAHRPIIKSTDPRGGKP